MVDGRRLDGYTISSPCEPNGSGELIRISMYGQDNWGQIYRQDSGSIHVISLKRESGRFSFHFMEVFQKCIKHIGKL